MVRGRRVRAVVACSRGDDCCSPNPKRKDQKIMLNGKLDNGMVTPTNKTSTITEFFQAVCDIDIKKLTEEPDITTYRNTRRKGTPTKLILTDECPVFNVFKTPIADKHKESPSTPHRIELAEENPNNKEAELPKPAQLPNKVQKKPEEKKLTDFFPVRRSVRKTKKTVLEEKQRCLELAVKSGKEDGLEVRSFEGKGRGVVASRDFERGEYVVEYAGDLIDPVEAKIREEKYALDQNAGCYMYYFKHCGQQYCIDATAETGKLGRLVNHSRNGNLATRTIMIDNKPRLVLIAKEDIKSGQEVLYDYGDRSKESLKHHPWLAY